MSNETGEWILTTLLDSLFDKLRFNFTFTSRIVVLAIFATTFIPTTVHAQDESRMLFIPTTLPIECTLSLEITCKEKLVQEKVALPPLSSPGAEETRASSVGSSSLSSATTIPKPAPRPKLTVNSGSHEDWMRAAGIPESDWGYVNYIVSGESGWNPNSRNKYSNACGLGQQLPCGKWAHHWNDPVGALIDMNSYVSRYGGWASAAAFWRAHHWY